MWSVSSSKEARGRIVVSEPPPAAALALEERVRTRKLMEGRLLDEGLEELSQQLKIEEALRTTGVLPPIPTSSAATAGGDHPSSSSSSSAPVSKSGASVSKSGTISASVSKSGTGVVGDGGVGPSPLYEQFAQRQRERKERERRTAARGKAAIRREHERRALSDAVARAARERGPLESAGCYIDLTKVAKEAGVPLGGPKSGGGGGNGINSSGNNGNSSNGGGGGGSGNGKGDTAGVLSAMGVGVPGGAVMARTAGRGFAAAAAEVEAKDQGQPGNPDTSQLSGDHGSDGVGTGAGGVFGQQSQSQGQSQSQMPPGSQAQSSSHQMQQMHINQPLLLFKRGHNLPLGPPDRSAVKGLSVARERVANLKASQRESRKKAAEEEERRRGTEAARELAMADLGRQAEQRLRDREQQRIDREARELARLIESQPDSIHAMQVVAQLDPVGGEMSPWAVVDRETRSRRAKGTGGEISIEERARRLVEQAAGAKRPRVRQVKVSKRDRDRMRKLLDGI